MISITINGVDRTRLVDYSSLRIRQVITSLPDSAEFVIKKFGDRTYAPTIGHTVVITQNGTTFFRGVITEMSEEYEVGDYVGYRITCSDYTYKLDSKLVVATFEEQTVLEIIQFLKESGYIPNEITINNVDVTTEVAYMACNYQPVSQVLTELAELVGADWYIDYDNDIHFNIQATEAAPFGLTDDGGKYIYESLIIRRDQTQVRNIIYVRGGEYLADTITAVFDGNGAQRYFNLPYKMSSVHLTVTGDSRSVGVEPLDDPSEFDAMHNFQEKLIFFREDKTPRDTSALAASQKIRISGQPYLPVLARVPDLAAIDAFTAKEHVIVDTRIKTKAAARQRAVAELMAYKTTISEAEFSTYEEGLHTGQTINVQSTLRGLDEDYIINKLEWKVFGVDASDNSTRLICKASLVTTRTFGYTQLLQRLLNKERNALTVNEGDILEVIQTFEDTASGVDACTFSASPDTTYRYSPSSRAARWGFSTWT